jgi:sucrose-6-phosphate hydrolase SacC (GH32 family)
MNYPWSRPATWSHCAQLRVFVDRSVVEVFVNGKQCVALRVYPGRNDSVDFDRNEAIYPRSQAAGKARILSEKT